MTNRTQRDERANLHADENLDPLTDEKGAHPIGTGVGAATVGLAAGAAVGTAAGPIGTVVGAVVGAVAGGLAGKAAAEQLNPTVEHDYWRGEYATRPYVRAGDPYDKYAPAYEFGWESHEKNSHRSFNEVEQELRSDWEGPDAPSRLGWDRASGAVRDAWDRSAKHAAHQAGQARKS